MGLSSVIRAAGYLSLTESLQLREDMAHLRAQIEVQAIALDSKDMRIERLKDDLERCMLAEETATHGKDVATAECATYKSRLSEMTPHMVIEHIEKEVDALWKMVNARMRKQVMHPMADEGVCPGADNSPDMQVTRAAYAHLQHIRNELEVSKRLRKEHGG